MLIDNDLKTLVTSGVQKSGNNWGTGMLIVHPVTKRLLLSKRTDTKNYCSPGGKVEIGESPLLGVLRETKEESNITCNRVKFYSLEMHVAENGKNWTSFMFLSDDFDDSNIVNQEKEVETWGWYTLEEALQMELFPPTRKSIERAIEVGLLSSEYPDTEDYITFEECPTSSSSVSAMYEHCAYSYKEPDQIFTIY